MICGSAFFFLISEQDKKGETDWKLIIDILKKQCDLEDLEWVRNEEGKVSATDDSERTSVISMTDYKGLIKEHYA